MPSTDRFVQDSGILLVLDAQGTILSSTPHWQHPVEPQAAHPNILDLIHPADRDAVAACLQQASATPSVRFCEGRCRMQNGEYRQLAWTFLHVENEPTLYAAGRETTQNADVSSRVDAQLRLLGSAVQQTKDAVIITTARRLSCEPEIVLVNPAFARMVASSPEELIGKPVSIFRDTIYDPDADENRVARETLLRGEVFATEASFTNPDGITYVFDWHTVPLSADGEHLTHYVSILHDITERKRHEQELEQERIFNEALRETIAALTSTLDLKTVMARILDNVGRVVPHDASNIKILEGDMPRVLYWRGYVDDDSEHPLDFGFPEEENRILRRLRERGEPYVIPSTQRDPEWLTSPLNQWVRSYVGVPICSHNQVIGFLNLDSATEDFFTPQHAERLAIFADYAAIAVENAQLYEAMSGHAADLAARVEERTVELKRSKEHVEAIFASTTDALAVTTTTGVIQQINPAFSRLFDLPEADVPGRRLDEFVEEPGALATALEELTRSLEPRRVELAMRRQDGTTFDADLVLSPMQEAKLHGIVCSLRDISAHKQLEIGLRRALEREKELGVLKSRFISMASHEFRTPLATILSSSELLRRYTDRMSADASRSHFDTIESGVHHMAQMIDDLLIIGKADEGRLHFSPEPLDLVSFCRALLEELFRSDEAARRIQFIHSADRLDAYADQSLIRQILTNLLSNALKYSPAPQPVTFRLYREDNNIVFTVADQGIGIPEADQPDLFEAFHRGSNVGVIEGSGLSLAVLKRAVDLHRGHISFDSKENVGTTFRVCLPIAK
jgi:PAS domain S-box-containing protein